jgi:hypothetical protein
VDALDVANQAIAATPDTVWLYINKAHALMLLGRVDESRTLYLQYEGTPSAIPSFFSGAFCNLRYGLMLQNTRDAGEFGRIFRFPMISGRRSLRQWSDLCAQCRVRVRKTAEIWPFQK